MCSTKLEIATPSETTPSAPGDSSPPSLGAPGSDPSGERTCEWTSHQWLGVCDSELSCS
jgi:hypothetical protein